MSVYGADDVMAVYRRLCVTAKDPLEEKPSLTKIICGLMKEQAGMIKNRPTSRLDDLIHYEFSLFNVTKVIYLNCRQPLPPDTVARWSVMRLGHHVLQRRRYKTDSCQGKQGGATSRDASIRFAWDKKGD